MSTPPDRPYPDSDLNVGGANERTVELFAAGGCRRYSEIGVYRGDTAERIAQVLGGEGRSTCSTTPTASTAAAPARQESPSG